MILGVTGLFCTGKDTVAEILKEMNFYHVSFSDLIRAEVKTRREKITRDILIKAGNELRTAFGADILARKALETAQDGENYVFTSIRNSSEVSLLQQRKDFLLVNVVAPDKTRLERIIQRNREEDPKTITELKEKERIESSDEANNQQLHKVTKMAKVVLANDASKEQLKTKVERLVQDHLYQLQSARPDWDTYFMNIAEQVKLRSTCLSAKKGALLVRDKMILSTGYNGSPRGIKHCIDGGCQRCTSRHLGKMKSGVYQEPCICCHSEENAIALAAYNGVSTKDSIMYMTFTPCVVCAKMIINAGIKKVISKMNYPDDDGKKLLRQARIEIISL